MLESWGGNIPPVIRNTLPVRLGTSFFGSKVILVAITTFKDEAAGVMVVLVVEKSRMMSDVLSGYGERNYLS